MTFDAIVVGLGATGGAAFYHLARNGARVLGIDAAAPPHDGGSSHGATRIYRQAYYEAPEYVPLALRALELWHELERESHQRLFTRTGALTIGPETGELVTGVLRSARTHDIRHEVLDRADVTRRFPAFAPPSGTTSIFEPTAGVLFVERCVDAHIALGRQRGGDARMHERVIAIEPGDNRVLVRTNNAAYEAGHVIVAAGAWTPGLLGLQDSFRITREMVHWFSPHTTTAAAPECPVSMIQFDDGPIFYSIPDFGAGFKAGLHHAGRITDPTAAPEDVTDAERVSDLVALLVPGAKGPLVGSAPCYYTTTPDHHFAVGRLATSARVILASACSGHGFKFAPALGEHLMQLVLQRESSDYRLFSPARLLRA